MLSSHRGISGTLFYFIFVFASTKIVHTACFACSSQDSGSYVGSRVSGGYERAGEADETRPLERICAGWRHSGEQSQAGFVCFDSAGFEAKRDQEQSDSVAVTFAVFVGM